MNNNALYVNMTELKIATDPVTFICLGLGSCIGLLMYDPAVPVAGVAHVMLPKSSGHVTHPGKFADTAVKALLEGMKQKGAHQNSLCAMIFGGGNMFPTGSKEKITIGMSNANAIIEELESEKISLLAHDVGGNSGRSIYFDTNTGRVLIKMVKEDREKLYQGFEYAEPKNKGAHR